MADYVVIPAEAADWICGDDTGLSSCAIWSHMVNGRCDGRAPSDPDDLGRCLRLLAFMPEWAARIGEMAQYGAEWKYLLGIWPELCACMEAEVGIDWAKGRSAPKTYALMSPPRMTPKEPA